MVTQSDAPILLPYRWRQGEHLAIVGDTGTGKSTLAAHILRARRHRIIFRSKPDDVEYGARLIRTAAGIGDVRFDAFELKPAYESQGREFARALDRVWIDGRWAVYLDELSYLEADLGLTPWIKRLLTQGRSKRITVACGMQRPVQVTRYALSSCTHLLCFGQEGRDAKTIGEVGAPYLRDVVQELDKFQFVWFNRRERTYMIGRLDLAADAIVDVEGADDAERTDGAEARTAAGG